MPTETAPPPVDWLFQELTAARLIAPDRAAQALAQFQATADRDTRSLAEFLVEAGLLTPYQADRALAGQARKLSLGPYLLAEPIGTGSLGTVYRATHRTTRQRVAVKVLPLRSLWNVLQAKRQVKVFAALVPHPAVVPFLDIDTAAGSHYLAWPFVEGESVDLLVARRGALPPAAAARFLADVADGLAVCHAKNIVHGLIKPSNLLLGPDHRAKILDLGVGAILQDNVADDESLLDTISTANTAMAMIDCAAPETLAEPTDRTPAGDLYSLGCVLYYLLTRRYPFPDGNVVDRIIAHQTETPRPVRELAPHVSDELTQVVARLMAKSPGDRPTAPQARELLLAAVATESAAELSLPARVTAPAPSWVAPPPSGASPAVEALDLPLKSSAAPSSRRGPDSATLDLFESDPDLSDTPVQQRLPRQPKPPPAVASPKSLADLPPRTVNWGGNAESSYSGSGSLTVPVPPPPQFATSVWRGILKRLMPWRRLADVVQLSLFGAAELAPGQTYRFQVYAHPPEAFTSVRTLSRAFQPETSLRGTGFANRPIARGQEVGLHLALAYAGVARSLVRFSWSGQTKPWAFEVYVPWETPAGPAPGVLTVGLNNYQVAEIRFEAVILPRSG